MPAHPRPLELICKYGPEGPSANLSDTPWNKVCEAIIKEFDQVIPALRMMLSLLAKISTILDISGAKARILRLLFYYES